VGKLSTQDRHADAAVTSSFPRCPVVHAGRTRRSQNSCGYCAPASPTKCARGIGGECLANDCDRPGRREAANILVAFIYALSASRGRVGERARQPPDRRRIHTVGPRDIDQRFAISKTLERFLPLMGI